jgi:flagellar protein FliL
MFGVAATLHRAPPEKSLRVNTFHPIASGIVLAGLPVTRTSRDGDVPLMASTHAPEAAAPKPDPRTEGKAKRNGKGKILIIAVLAVIVLGGGGGAAYWMWAGNRAAASAEATAEHDGEATKPVTKENLGLVELPGFLVNLADPGGQAYLRVTLNLLVADEEQARLFAEKPAMKSLLRSSILEVLALQTGGVLVTPEGKGALKRAIIERVKALGLKVEVEDVLFSDFVVQY